MILRQHKESLNQFLTFAVIGVVNTALDFGIYYLLTRHTTLFDVASYKKYIANIISYFCAATFSFFANRTLTFKKSDRATLGEVLRFYSTNISAIIVNSFLLLLFVKVFAIHDLLAKVLATVFTIFLNFFLQRFWVFTSPKTNNI